MRSSPYFLPQGSAMGRGSDGTHPRNDGGRHTFLRYSTVLLIITASKNHGTRFCPAVLKKCIFTVRGCSLPCCAALGNGVSLFICFALITMVKIQRTTLIVFAFLYCDLGQRYAAVFAFPSVAAADVSQEVFRWRHLAEGISPH